MVRALGLSKSLGNRLVVDRVSLSVEEGELVSVLGPSGCGKTTLLRMIAGLLEPDAGEIRLGSDVVFSSGSGIDVPAAKRNVGMVFQSYALWPHYTVFNNVAYPLRVRRLAGTEMRDRVSWALDLVKLAHLQNRYPGELSGGQQQRIALARAIVYSPRLLLLDEPLANLDARVRESVRFEIRELQRKAKIAAIYVTHDQGEAMSLSDRVIVMEGGKVAQEGPPGDIYRHPASAFVAEFVGTSNFIPGTIAGIEGDRYLVRTDDGADVVCRDRAGRRAAGERVLLSVRPEDFEVHTVRRAAANDWSAQVVDSTFLGNVVSYRIAIGRRTVQVQTDTHVGLHRSSDPVFLSVREARARMLDPAAAVAP